MKYSFEQRAEIARLMIKYADDPDTLSDKAFALGYAEGKAEVAADLNEAHSKRSDTTNP